MDICNFIMNSLNLELDDIKSLDFKKIDGVYNIFITLTDLKPECPDCGGKAVIKDYSTHTYYHLPCFGVPSKIVWRRRRYVCKDGCGTFMERNPFGPEKSHQSYALLDQIAKDLKNPHKSFTDIAKDHHVSPSTVQLYADSFIQAPRQPLPENLGIDEIRSDMAKYGGAFLGVFTDNTRRCLTEILPNRSKHTLSNYLLDTRKDERDGVHYVTIDLWEPYRDIARQFFKNCCVAADPFHVITHLTQDFTSFRVSIMKQCVYNSPEYYLLKNWKWLFFASDKQLDNDPEYNGRFGQRLNRRDLLNLMLGIDAQLKDAYELMDDYRSFNSNATEDDCADWLDKLISDFEQANLPCYGEFIGILNEWKQEIINSFKKPDGFHRLSNALTENTNEQIRSLMNVSNGYTNFDRFRARALYCLNDHVFYVLTQALHTNKRKGKKRGHYNKHKNNN